MPGRGTAASPRGDGRLGGVGRACSAHRSVPGSWTTCLLCWLLTILSFSSGTESGDQARRGRRTGIPGALRRTSRSDAVFASATPWPRSAATRTPSSSSRRRSRTCRSRRERAGRRDLRGRALHETQASDADLVEVRAPTGWTASRMRLASTGTSPAREHLADKPDLVARSSPPSRQQASSAARTPTASGDRR